MNDGAATAAFVAVLGATSLVALTARWFRRSSMLPDMADWALANRRCGSVLTWFLLGGSVFTAYTFAAVPGLTYGVGALGFFPLAYTAMLAPILYVVLPPLWAAARRTGSVTIADHVGATYGSSALMLAVALTGILATMPYIALQLLGVRAVLTAGGLYPEGLAGDLALTAVFAVLASATYTSGLRAPALISVVKGALIFGATVGVLAAVLGKFGGVDALFGAAALRAPSGALQLRPDQYSAFATLALGSALALPLYPHVLTVAFAATGPVALRRASIWLPAWTLVLGLFGLFGLAALAAGIVAPVGNAEVAVPLLVADLLPGALGGLVFGAIAVGALVPAAVMSVAVAGLFTRNIYVGFFAPAATPKNQVRVARTVSLLAKVAALAFVFGLRDQVAINLQLLGSLWILQTLPTVAFGLVSRWWHRRALLAGWATGMLLGTWLTVASGFDSVVVIASIPLAITLIALAMNVAVATVATPLLDRIGVDRGRGPGRPPIAAL